MAMGEKMAAIYAILIFRETKCTTDWFHGFFYTYFDTQLEVLEPLPHFTSSPGCLNTKQIMQKSSYYDKTWHAHQPNKLQWYTD